MPEPSRTSLTEPVAAAPQALGGGGFEVLVETPSPGLLRRFFTTQRHFSGMLFGAIVAVVRDRPPLARGGLRFLVLRALAAIGRMTVSERYLDKPFPVQLRRRLEDMGPTYIKLGQILSLREDLLPPAVTDELKNLLDRLPAVSAERFVELLEKELERPASQAFEWIDPTPLGSASIGQIHQARTRDGEAVILKMVKPGIRETLVKDVVLLKLFGSILQLFLGRFQPRRLIDEFCHYTLREADLRTEAENAETFAANFKDVEEVIFPKIYREFTTERLVVMELIDGLKPNDPGVQALLTEEERDRVIDLGAESIIRMLYKDGFFHADLHPGNLMILPGARIGFIDLGMVGRFEDELRRTLLYYYYCLVMGDVENAARYLAAIAQPGPSGDPKGFRRDVEEICRRWRRSSSFEDYSIGQLILESVSKGARYRMYFPVELVLMVKAIVTFEGVGHYLKPGFDVAAVSQSHINRIFLGQFSPLRIARESLRGAPELVDALIKAPMLVTEGLKVLEQTTRKPPENPFTGIRGTVFAGFCIVSGAIVAALKGPWPLWAALFALGLVLALRKGR